MSVSLLLDSISDPDRCPFVESPPEYLHIKCPVCLDILLPEPYLVSCCGNHFCKKCIESLRRTDPCPLCKASGNAQFKVPDKGLGRALNSLNIFCPNKDKSCDWEGTLGTVQHHLATSCGFVLVPCKYKCDFSIMRRELELHETQRCPKRPQTCKHCETYTATYVLVLQHEKACPKGIIDCENQCGSSFAREEQSKHLEQCPNVSIKCNFRYAGCTWVGHRGDYEDHLDTDWKDHVSSITTHMIDVVKQQDKTIAIVTAQINDHNKTIEALSAQITSLDRDIKAGSMQMASKLSPNAITADSSVKSPSTLTKPPVLTKPPEAVKSPVPIKPPNTVKPPAPIKPSPYGVKPSVSVKSPAPVKSPAVVKPASSVGQLPTLSSNSAQSNPTLPQATSVPSQALQKKFAIQQFHSKKAKNSVTYSPCFTLSGYSMQLTLYTNGAYEGEGSCVSIFLNMLSKEYNKWKASKYKPIKSSLIVRLQSQFPTEFSHYDVPINFKTDPVDADSFMSPMGTRNGKPVFIRHTELGPYLQRKNDQLNFEVYF